jgi:hypothetical protein
MWKVLILDSEFLVVSSTVLVFDGGIGFVVEAGALLEPV